MGIGNVLVVLCVGFGEGVCLSKTIPLQILVFFFFTWALSFVFFEDCGKIWDGDSVLGDFFGGWSGGGGGRGMG